MTKDVNLSDIHTDSYYEDAVYDSMYMNDLKASILENGQIVDVVVTHCGGDKYLLVCGRKRFKIFKELGRSTIRCVVLPLTDEGVRAYRSAD